MRELHLFAGAGGGILGGLLLGHTPVCAVEIDPYCQEVLRARQRDGFLPAFPIHGDISTFDGTPWAGLVDIVAGGFPCQDISVAGKGAGIDGERSGLWRHMARVIGEVRPRFAFVENSPALVGRGLAVVLGDLAALGYDARWTVLGAHHVRMAHRRARMWILAHDAGADREERCLLGARGEWGASLSNRGLPGGFEPQEWRPSDSGADSQSGVRGMAHGVADRVDRLRAIGNGQVPRVAAAAWRELMSWEVPA